MSTEIVDADDLVEALQVQLSSLSTLITDDGYALVCDQTIQELGWSYPMTTPTKVLWAIKRGTRHAIYLLLIASANKFKYKQVNLQHRFDHFYKLIEEMDKEFAEAMATDIGAFTGIDSFHMFGTKIDAGFTYRFDGKDQTYDYDKYVNFAPMEDA
ncbi:MAG: hypothetical protein WC346_17180 [Methanogenium sp.]|jgi:hypothetical protein